MQRGWERAKAIDCLGVLLDEVEQPDFDMVDEAQLDAGELVAAGGDCLLRRRRPASSMKSAMRGTRNGECGWLGAGRRWARHPGRRYVRNGRILMGTNWTQNPPLLKKLPGRWIREAVAPESLPRTVIDFVERHLPGIFLHVVHLVVERLFGEPAVL